MEKEFSTIVKRAGISEGDCLLLAISGGIDSVVLLDLLVSLKSDFPLRLQVLHLNHQLRVESATDAEFVRKLCSQRKIPCHIEVVDVAALAKQRRVSLETAGREARREALLAWAETQGCTRIVLAHHQDDQAETFVQRLLRGTGKSGLVCMIEQDGPWWRPLLGFSRQQIVSYATQHSLSWVEDASNSDTRFLRNRIRHHLLPELSEYNPQITQRLTSLSRQFQLEEDFWTQQIAGVWPKLQISVSDGLRLDRKRLLEYHPALQLRLMREGLRHVRGDLRAIEAVHLESLLGLLCGKRSQAELDLPGCWAARRYEQLWLRKTPPQISGFDLPLEVDTPLLLPDGRILEAAIHDQVVPVDGVFASFDATGMDFPLRVRSPKPGDRFRPSGMNGQRKIKDFLIDLKLEKEQRISLPMLANEGEILWLVGLRRSALLPVVDGCQKTLVVRLLKGRKSETKPL